MVKNDTLKKNFLERIALPFCLVDMNCRIVYSNTKFSSLYKECTLSDISKNSNFKNIFEFFFYYIQFFLIFIKISYLQLNEI
jgi:hypothetical protein